jgi:alkyl hydroperoxide reductase subunit AhpC
MVFFSFKCFGQTAPKKSYPQINKGCPDFHLNDVEYYNKKRVSLNDFFGKWLVLDFWTKTCTVCVESFPKINQLQKEFQTNIQFLLIGKNDVKYNKGIKVMYEKFRSKKNLNLVIAFDSLLFDQFGVGATPHVVIIDPKGIVRAITHSSDLTAANLNSLINGGNPMFVYKQNIYEESTEDTLDLKLPLTIEYDKIDTLVQFTSILSRWKRGMPIRIVQKVDEYLDKGFYESTGLSLDYLYKLAYFGYTDWSISDSLYGHFWSNPVHNVKDGSLFSNDFQSSIGYYNYSFSVPNSKATTDYMKYLVQCDLKKYFGYDVEIVTKQMPCWNLVANSGSMQKIKTKGSPYNYTGDFSSIVLTNVSISQLLRTIWGFHQSEPPFIDRTGIDTNIDITLNCLMTDFDDLRTALKRNGLDLVRGEKEMKVIVIRDPKKE